ncbi:MAG: 4-alpha-glucanotransferase, partial [bacterium]
NDTGFDYAPYDSQTTFVLDPMYLSIENMKYIDKPRFEREIKELKERFPAGNKRVDYGVKKAKLGLLRKIFDSRGEFAGDYESFCEKASFWLEDYAVYKVIKDVQEQKNWENWDEKYRARENKEVENIVNERKDDMVFYRWLQFELFEQMKNVKEYCNEKGIYIQGDLPFLVSRDSADVWANRDYFKLGVSSGAPPDMYFAKGQRWGMPPYNWENIRGAGFDYLVEKVKYTENFYDMFRIDHFVGLFRLWTIDLNEPEDTYGLNGKFDPEDESLWKEHGREILEAMTESSLMLPCAEDLGVVPQCSFEILEEFALPGMDVQRWTRDWGETYEFLAPEKYRVNSAAIISSHDMTPFLLWWEKECGTVDAMLVEKKCGENSLDYNEIKSRLFDMEKSTEQRLRFREGIKSTADVNEALEGTGGGAEFIYGMFSETAAEKDMFLDFAGAEKKAGPKEVLKAALVKVNETASVFSINLLQDFLSLGGCFDGWDNEDLRVNTPGSVDEKNWTIVMPLSLEEMIKSGLNAEIQKIHKDSGRR